MDIEREIRKELGIMSNNIDELKRKIERRRGIVGRNRLACNYSNGTPQYFINGEYVSKKNMNLVRNIAQQAYEEEITKALEKQQKILNTALKFYDEKNLEKIYKDLCRGKKNVVTPMVETDEEFVKNWKNVKYEPSSRWDDVKGEILTIRGERVRSKAEKIIADELFHYGIPYRYEYPYELVVKNQKKTFRPDFTVLNSRTRKEFLIEHLGMMDKYGYYNSSLNKLDVLEKNGFLIGVNLLLFHETNDEPLSIPLVRQYIEEFLL